ncbi:phospholipase B1, membrane-associated [Eptesicus fuscus]|uniref:phospholipase B1, membrane-associated n=1 Tax=Eptesicus fuscus TaxID=29078 RepID=UPI002403C627|nr:phospholipase B1, membrane-associated [Eptesicus fuscus]
MGPRPHTFLLGLLLLLGPGTTQAHSFPGENTLEEQPWPELQSLESFPFVCDLQKSGPNVPSESVHSLRPSDIKFVAAIGNVETLPDPGTAGAKQPWVGKRPPQACMGVVTVLSDIIRHFNPSVLRPVCTPGRRVLPHIGAEDLWMQAKELVRSMKKNQQLDFQNDWKLINVFFSDANQCHLCPSTQQHRHVTGRMGRLTRMLDYLLQEVPRAFVNLVDLSEAAGGSPRHQLSLIAEPCRCSEDTSKLSRVVAQWSYQESWDRLLASSRYNKQESFSVVYQPFFYEEALSPHSGKWPHQDPTTLALNLWNIMMEPAGQKDELLSAHESWPMKCPSQKKPYLFTYTNSNYLSGSPKPHENPEVRDETEIRCPAMDPSDKIPTSVHRLKPADIKVIAALGDSLTAGNGAGAKPGDVLDVLTQYRGLSWSVGGDGNVSSISTLANILREFNPSLRGFSVGTGKENSPGAFLNQAVAGARAEDLPVQARRLVGLMKNDTKINFQEDWKIITLFIGGNDLCDFCNDPAHYSPQNFTDNIGKALDILHAEVPRAFVNLVKTLQIISLRELYNERKVHCPRLILRNLCPCVLKYDDNSTELASLIEVNKKYQERTHQLVEGGRYDTREDFTVVVQPFFERVDMPKTPEGLPDSSFFAPDCFHFSKKSHAHSGSALWNNMLEPVGQKARWHDFESKINITCPNKDSPFLSTYKNSVQGHGSQLLCGDRTPSDSPPTSVHALRPADIRVVAALGDSLTAGNGIGSKPDDLPDVTTQYRGLSYSSGGDGSLETVTTLPNILRKFNRFLTGYALGTGKANDTNAFLNQAVPGAKAEELTSQVQTLVQRMKDDHRVNFHEDWKVITVLIGGSDLCDFCTDSNLYSAANFFDHLRNALDTLHREVPRALVNLVDFMSPSVMRQVFLGNPDKCPVQQASVLCNCVLTPRDSSLELARLEAITRAYQSSMRELVESGRYDTREDFSVVLQPFFHNTRLPVLEDGSLDMSFFAPDCIHPSQKFHSQLSRALWVNMLEPLGRKTDTLDLTADIPLPCPTQNEPFLRTLRNSNYTYPTKPAIENWGSDFLCTEWTPSNSVPTSVHELRPGDIKVVAALGDSLTTAVGARPSNSSDQLVSWRGLSWSAGGDGVLETHTTLPNILKKFNPQILGFSTGTREDTAGLNVAVEGARARDMPAQARDLVARMKNSPEINLEKDWKLITLFIGSNDLCHYCENPEAHSAGEYVRHIQQALDVLSELPRAFVNVVEVMELTSLHQGQGGKCDMPLAAQSNCTCFRRFQENSPEMQELKKVNWNFQSGVSRFSYWHQYLQREDFTVVVQPFFQNTLVPLNERGGADLTFFSEDCFHFSERGHAEMAIALWNNMLEPVGRKTTSNNFTYSRTKLKCPSPESPYLHTLRNSQLLQNQAEEGPNELSWAVPVAAGGGLAVGVGVVMAWRAMRSHQKENPPISLNTVRL